MATDYKLYSMKIFSTDFETMMSFDKLCSTNVTDALSVTASLHSKAYLSKTVPWLAMLSYVTQSRTTINVSE